MSDERKILETIQKGERDHPQENIGGFVRGEYVKNQSGFGGGAMSQEDFNDLLDILAGKDEIEVNRLTRKDQMVKLAPKGKERLRMTEEHYDALRHPSSTIHNAFHGNVTGFAQTTAPNSPITQNVTTIAISQNDPALVAEVARLITELKAHPEVSEDALIEAQQLQLEITKKDPQLGTVAKCLNAIKTAAITIGSVVAIVDKIQHMIPGVMNLIHHS
jgi:hypothetical protein